MKVRFVFVCYKELFALLRQVELVRLVEYLAHLVNLKERCASRIAQTEASAKVSNLVVERYVALLAKHAQGSRKHVFGRSLLLLMDRNNAIAEVEPTLSLLLVADGQNRIRTTEGSQVANSLARKRVGNNASHT